MSQTIRKNISRNNIDVLPDIKIIALHNNEIGDVTNRRNIYEGNF